MTKEQIINHLRYVQRELSEARGSDYSGVKALEEAIKELSSVEKNGNSIDRQKVLNTLDFADNALTDEERTVENYKELLTECIKVLPSVEKKGEWIPASERLPLLRGFHKISDDVLITNGFEIDMGYLVERKGKIFWHYYGSEYEVGIKDEDNDARAWMPLPETYE